ncbi:hypothetical protein TNIN_117651 [Trichonephila inaurata madagascariensis]|uniref:Uncharacterized protein n=1 Tax=Trichonephila inaurata madagascariensis TaxID=2747483 RepID=A0A8X6YLS8_9ARAC|nr:hypothetical protein TNIN_117651 [Trichonephila inaurata madagascariensis]
MMNEVEALRKSHGDALEIHEGISHDNELSTFLPDQRDKAVSEVKECSSASLSGSTFTTTVEIHTEGQLPKKRHARSSVKMCQGTGPFHNQSCIYYGPETIEVLESIEIPETEPMRKLKIISDSDSDSSSEIVVV